MGKFLAAFLVLTAVIGGGAMYYLQVYHFYEPVAVTGPEDVQLTVAETGVAEPLEHADFQGIDAISSPIRYRACFTTPLSPAELAKTYAAYPDAEPLTAPGWFECFDAKAIGAALEEGRAQAFLGQENILYGIDRIVAITEDGRGFAWQQINECGEKVFDGERAPEGCPVPPEQAPAQGEN